MNNYCPPTFKHLQGQETKIKVTVALISCNKYSDLVSHGGSIHYNHILMSVFVVMLCVYSTTDARLTNVTTDTVGGIHLKIISKEFE